MNSCLCEYCTNVEAKRRLYRELGGYLTPFQDFSSLPDNSYTLLDMSGGKYYVLDHQYANFMEYYILHKIRAHLTLSLNRAVCHTLVLDIDCKTEKDSYIQYRYIQDVLVPKIRINFQIDALPTFSVLVACCNTSMGLHVFFPEIMITNDDYELLCSRLAPEFEYYHGDVAFRLDTPLNFSLPFASKRNDPYTPSYFFFFRHNGDHLTLNFEAQDLESQISFALKASKNRKTKHSAFCIFLQQPLYCRDRYLRHLMNPINTSYAFEKRHVVYKTVFLDSETCDESMEQVGSFEFIVQQNRRSGKVLYKDRRLKVQPQLKQVYMYLKLYTSRIENLDTKLMAVRHWYTQFSAQRTPLENDIFRDLNERLQLDNATLMEVDHPIKMLLSYRDGLFFMPVFYALHNELQLSSITLCQHLMNLLDDTSWIDKVGDLDPQLVAVASQDYTYHTLIYCSGYTHEPTARLEKKLEHILETMAFSFQFTMDEDEMKKVVTDILNVYFNVLTCDRKRYIWNPVKHHWLMVQSERELSSILGTVVSEVLKHYRKLFHTASKIKHATLVTYALQNCLTHALIEGANLDLDSRKWILRTRQGALDLLTGHMGQVVPEHFLSNKMILPKETYLPLGDPDLVALYDTIWQRDFFERYVATLKSQNIDYFPILKEMTKAKSEDAESLLHAYIHLCKFLCFNYEELSFFLYPLASNLVATNYGKFLFILQGKKNNGKSQLFSLLNAAFGQYAATVDNDAFAAGRKTETKPEIAQTIYCCRLLIVEELAGNINENFLKILTGNSVVSARNLYDTPLQGIPQVKIWISTNKAPSCITTPAFCERVLPFHFQAAFLKNLDLDLQAQIEHMTFEANFDDTLLAQSAKGLFLTMYFTFQKHFLRKDGLLPYPPIPESVLAYKKKYLEITDVYNQFKTIMDVQEVPGEVLTRQDLISAVRQFLTSQKLAYHTQDQSILDRFDEEYGDRKFNTQEAWNPGEMSGEIGDRSGENSGDMSDKENTIDSSDRSLLNHSNGFAKETKKRKRKTKEDVIKKKCTEITLYNNQANSKEAIFISSNKSLDRIRNKKMKSNKKNSYICYKDIVIKAFKPPRK